MTFRHIDKDRNGTLDRQEFEAMFATIGMQEVHKEDIDLLFNKFDDDGSGDIDYKEFAAHITDGFTEEAGSLIDLPATRNTADMNYRTDEERMSMARRDITKQILVHRLHYAGLKQLLCAGQQRRRAHPRQLERFSRW